MDGVQVVFKYGQPPSESDGLGQELQSLHMKVVDGYIWALVYYYECHRTKELRPSLLGPGQYCEDDPYPNLADENALLAAVAAPVTATTQKSPTVVGDVGGHTRPYPW